MPIASERTIETIASSQTLAKTKGSDAHLKTSDPVQVSPSNALTAKIMKLREKIFLKQFLLANKIPPKQSTVNVVFQWEHNHRGKKSWRLQQKGKGHSYLRVLNSSARRAMQEENSLSMQC